MTTCPYCAEQILPNARKCKHCGEWLDRGANREVNSAANSEHRSAFRPGRSVASIVLAAIGWLWVLLSLSSAGIIWRNTALVRAIGPIPGLIIASGVDYHTWQEQGYIWALITAVQGLLTGLVCIVLAQRPRVAPR